MNEGRSRAVDLVPHGLPDSPYERLLLYAIRRMAAGGLNDAFAAQALIGGFGVDFRRPLVLLRAFMGEVARIAETRLVVAPCCCGRMTGHERILIDGVGRSIDDPAGAHRALTKATGLASCLGLLTSAQAVAASFADLGMPLGSMGAGD